MSAPGNSQRLASRDPKCGDFPGEGGGQFSLSWERSGPESKSVEGFSTHGPGVPPLWSYNCADCGGTAQHPHLFEMSSINLGYNEKAMKITHNFLDFIQNNSGEVILSGVMIQA